MGTVSAHHNAHNRDFDEERFSPGANKAGVATAATAQGTVQGSRGASGAHLSPAMMYMPTELAEAACRRNSSTARQSKNKAQLNRLTGHPLPLVEDLCCVGKPITKVARRFAGKSRDPLEPPASPKPKPGNVGSLCQTLRLGGATCQARAEQRCVSKSIGQRGASRKDAGRKRNLGCSMSGERDGRGARRSDIPEGASLQKAPTTTDAQRPPQGRGPCASVTLSGPSLRPEPQGPCGQAGPIPTPRGTDARCAGSCGNGGTLWPSGCAGAHISPRIDATGIAHLKNSECNIGGPNSGLKFEV